MSSENEIIYRGKRGEVFASSNSVSGSISESGENWTVSLAGTKVAVREYISAAAKLFVGSSWSPVSLPSRNVPRISGWTIDYSGNTATLRISYSFNPMTTFFTPADETLPPESKTESLTSAVSAVSLQNCPGIWTAAQFADDYANARAMIVEYAKSRKGIRPSSENYDALVAKWEENFIADLSSVLEDSEEIIEPWKNPAFIKISNLLASGQDLYNATTYQISITEKLNEKPELVGLNTYNTPPVEKLTLPSDRNAVYWYQNADSLSVAENGQYQRTRTWLGVASKSALYETKA